MGVAVGTLIPIALSTTFVLYPAACRLVDLPITTAATRAILPAVWPAAPAACVLWLTRDLLPASVLWIALQSLLGLGIYLSVFIAFAVGRTDRELYLNRMRQLLTHRRDVTPGVERAPVPGALAGGQ